jgi:uncharacterized protein (TIGR00297 family)
LVLSLVPAVVGIAATALLAFLAVEGRALTPIAGFVATVFGALIVVVAGFPYLALLILFVVGSVLATRYRLAEKSERHVQEGTHGERGISNVVAHIVVPTALALTALGSPSVVSASTRAVLYASALAFGASDTFASEFGVLSRTPRSILHFRPVEPGPNGGVSGLGEVFAFVGAGLTGVMALGLFALFGSTPGSPVEFVLVITAAGFLACQIDSVLGETLENRGYLSKHSTNFLGMLSAVAIASIAVLTLAGGL